jgi:hypothetical protein
MFFVNRVACLLLLSALVAPLSSPAQLLAPSPAAAAAPAWEASLLTLEATFKNYDYFQPWNEPTRSLRKHALVVGPREIITTAHYLANHTLLRVQKGGRGRWTTARLRWLDAQANLAMLTVDEPAFWNGLSAAPLAETLPKANEFTLVRWRDGNLESRRVEFGKFSVGTGVLGLAGQMSLEIGTELPGVGWAEIVVRNGQVLGLTAWGGSRAAGVLPAPFIRQIIAEREVQGRESRPLGYFDFSWQALENPETARELGLPGETRGVRVLEPSRGEPAADGLRAGDVILEIDGHAIGAEGDFRDPSYGYLNLEALSTRGRFAGDGVELKVWREGAELKLPLRLRAARFEDEPVAREVEGAPKYLIAGGLVFQPLVQPFLRGWGDEWRRRAPYRLQHYQFDDSGEGRKARVLLGSVLPDPINLGYQDEAMRVVDTINGKLIESLQDVAAALETPSAGAVHEIRLARGGGGSERVLLDAAMLEEATARVLERYSIPAARRL